MEADGTTETITIVISVLSSLLLVLSEILPYIKKIHANGIIGLIVDIFKKFKYSQVSLDDNILYSRDNTINTNLLFNKILQQHTYISNLIESSKSDSNIIFSKIIEQQDKMLSLIEAKKMQTIDKYELEHIKTFIRMNFPAKRLEIKSLSKINKELLLSLGYIVDYDSTCDLDVIKW